MNNYNNRSKCCHNRSNSKVTVQSQNTHAQIIDYGPNAFATNIQNCTKKNNNFRTIIWTGDYLQLTLMSISVGEDIGLEIHTNTDQFIRIEEGSGLVKMGESKDRLNFQKPIHEGCAFIIPAGTWHNLFNTGDHPIKLYSIYSPPQHPKCTVHKTKSEAETSEKTNHQ